MKKKALIIIALAMFLPAISSDASTASLDLSPWLTLVQADSATSQYQANKQADE